MKRLVLLAAMLLCILNLYAQESSDFVQIAGKVVVKGSSQPLHFASVTLAGTNISNVTNSEGVFTLKIPASQLADGLVTVSHLGYAETVLRISDFKDHSSSEKPLKISIVPVNYTLDPAVVSAHDPLELLKAAIMKINENYATENIGMLAFYREMVKKGSSKYLAMNEAIVDINKASYSSYHGDRAGIYKGRGSKNYDSTDTLFIKYVGGLGALLEIDNVKNPFAGVPFDELGMYYEFKNGTPQVLGNRFFRVVEFTKKSYINDILMRGRVFIDSETLAIGRTEMSINVEGRDDAVSIFILKRPPHIRIEVLSAQYVVNYRMSGNKWYYEYAKSEVRFATRKKHSLFRNTFTVTSEIAVTDFKPGVIPIKNDARIKFRDYMTEKVEAFTDENFWENYNIIEPDQSIEKIIKKIVKQLKKHKTEN